MIALSLPYIEFLITLFAIRYTWTALENRLPESPGPFKEMRSCAVIDLGKTTGDYGLIGSFPWRSFKNTVNFLPPEKGIGHVEKLRNK